MNEIDELLQNLSYKEKELLLAELEGYSENPVGIETFIDDPFYLGETLGGMVYPVWREELKDIYPTPFTTKYSEAILTGAIGTGKSTISVVGTLYDLYKLLCLKSPQTKFNLMKDTEIVLALFSASTSLADDVVWDKMYKMLMASMWFSKKFRASYSRMGKTSRGAFVFQKSVSVALGSQAIHALGKAVFGGVLDEANFQKKRITNQAYETYSALKRRRESRFMQYGGKLPGVFWIVSSKKDNEDFTENRIEEAKKETKIISMSLWEAKKHLGMYSGDKFKVFIGSKTRDPFILKDVVVGMDPADILEVPLEHRQAFEQNIMESLRDIAGMTSSKAFNLFKFKDTVMNVATVPHRFNQEVIKLDFFDKDEKLFDFANKKYFQEPMNRGSARFVHIDTALSGDRLGAACSYIKGLKKELQYFEFKGVMLPKKIVSYDIVVEWVLAIKSKLGQEIPIYKITDFFIILSKMGWNFAAITCDGYQQAIVRQALRLAGLRESYLSVDRTRDQYHALKYMVDFKRVLLPRHNILIKELFSLEDDGNKVDHPVYSSKDIADGVAGSVWNALHGNYHPFADSSAKFKKDRENVYNQFKNRALYLGEEPRNKGE